MPKTTCKIRIGTSGWSYNHWLSRFYPDNLPKSEWFSYYAENFDTVELNNTFYQLPKQTTVKNWYKQAPKNFLYSVKASRFITHIKRLKNIAEPLDRFLKTTSLLKTKLGPILYQLPPAMHKDLPRLKNFLLLLPKNTTSVFEFRHKSWFSDDTYDLLDKHNCVFCIHDLSGVPSPRIITSRQIYIRFHGPTSRYAGYYSQSALLDWADWIKEHSKEVSAIYAYFNNDFNAFAVKNAKELRKIL